MPSNTLGFLQHKLTRVKLTKRDGAMSAGRQFVS